MINQIILLATDSFYRGFCVGILLIATTDVPGPGPVAADLSEAATSSSDFVLLLPWRPVTPVTPLTPTRTETGPVTGEEVTGGAWPDKSSCPDSHLSE